MSAAQRARAAQNAAARALLAHGPRHPAARALLTTAALAARAAYTAGHAVRDIHATTPMNTGDHHDNQSFRRRFVDRRQ